jgi:hypothetical protein
MVGVTLCKGGCEGNEEKDIWRRIEERTKELVEMGKGGTV